MLTVIIILALLVYGVITLAHLQSRISESRANLESLDNAVSEQAAKNEDMEHAIENSDDEEILKEVARDKLGLAEYDEKVFYAG